MRLPSRYYGSIDATELWVLLFADAVGAGLSEDRVRPLIGSLRAALGWLVDYADPDHDGFLEYFDPTGKGLANQGWKDSGDSIRWKDGNLAQGPIALCEVQGYAYEAATRGGGSFGQIRRKRGIGCGPRLPFPVVGARPANHLQPEILGGGPVRGLPGDGFG